MRLSLVRLLEPIRMLAAAITCVLAPAAGAAPLAAASAALLADHLTSPSTSVRAVSPEDFAGACAPCGAPCPVGRQEVAATAGEAGYSSRRKPDETRGAVR